MPYPGEANKQLYKAVAAQPDEDGPRLAYADWFEQNGQPERARFIRLQCEAARLPLGGPERSAPTSEADHLFWGHRKAWLAERPNVTGASWGFLRGFPEYVVFDSFKALAGAEAEVFRYPVRRIGFTNLRSVARLAGWAGLARVEELDLSACNLREEDLGLLIASPHVARVTWLDLARNSALGAGGARLLAGWSRLARLRCLRLTGACIGDEGLAALAASPHLGEVAAIDLDRNLLGPAGLRALADTGCWPALQSLQLANNLAGDEGAKELARASQWTSLIRLLLSKNRIADEGAAALAGAEHLASLRSLSLWGNAIGDAGAVALAGSPHLARLRTLHLSGNLIGEKGGWALGRSPHLVELRELHLGNNAMHPTLCGAVEERYKTQDLGPLDAAAKLTAPTVAAELAPPPPLARGEAPVDEDGLIRAIIDAPDDDLPRLVYADWLEEHGQPARAELLRLQLGLLEQRSSTREQELVRAIVARCPAAMREQMERCQAQRGLLRATVSMRTFQSRAFQEQAPGWMHEARIHGLDLDGTTKHWTKVANSPVLAAIHELELRGNSMADSGLAVLLGSPHLAGLHTLRISRNSLRRGLEALASASTLPRLRKLELPYNGISLSAILALANWPQSRRLTTLDLASNWLSAAEASVVFNSPNLNGLVNLNLTYNRVGDGGARVLASAAHLAGLKSLALTNNAIGPDGARSLAESPHLRGLRLLYLNGNQIGDEGANALLDSPMLDEVQVLTLSSPGMSEGTTARLQQKLGARLRLSRW